MRLLLLFVFMFLYFVPTFLVRVCSSIASVAGFPSAIAGRRTVAPAPASATIAATTPASAVAATIIVVIPCCAARRRCMVVVVVVIPKTTTMVVAYFPTIVMLVPVIVSLWLLRLVVRQRLGGRTVVLRRSQIVGFRFTVRVQMHTVLVKSLQRKRVEPALVPPNTPAAVYRATRADAPARFAVGLVAQQRVWFLLVVGSRSPGGTGASGTRVEKGVRLGTRGHGGLGISGGQQGGVFLAQQGLHVCQGTTAVASHVHNNVAPGVGTTGLDRSGAKGRAAVLLQ